MTPERRKQIDDLFDAVLDQPAADRAAFLATACVDDADLRSEVEALLAAHARTGGALDRSLSGLAAAVVDGAQVDRHIGPYRVLRELGRGGMGVVYLAERDDGQFRRRVAVKVVRSGVDDGQIQRRFAAERQILASLSHPNIAQLLDGGVTDGQVPYLVMEYVEGRPITTHCDEQRLDIAARLRLFQDVCAAVHHAHQNLVIHRDLKPSNIVVDGSGRVKLLDFGIAKLLNPSLGPALAPFTRVEQWVMTPDYASPEQVRGQSLSTASDVYALGVILYELLTGRRPYHLATGSPEEVVAAVCETDPERPSTRAAGRETITAGGVTRQLTPEAVSAARDTTAERLTRQLRGDLDAIVMMALRKEPARRYGSPQGLSDDIQRYLDGLPVAARQGSRRYYALKFLRRHRVEAAAAALVGVSLVAGVAMASRQAAVAGRERDRAEVALAQAEQVTTFLMDLFRSGEMDPGRAAGDVTARDLLRRGTAHIDALGAQPAVQARLLGVLGRLHHGMGEFDDAGRLLARAVAIRRTLDDPTALADSLVHLSWVHRSRRDLDEARRLVAEALDIRRRVLPADHEDIADAVYELGFVAPTSQELEARYRESLAMLERTGARPDWQIRLRQGLSTSLRRQGRFPEALAMDREAVALAIREFGPTHVRTGSAMIHLADQVRDIEQDLAAAERLYLDGMRLIRRESGDHHLDLIHPLNALAVVETRRGNFVAAEKYHREALRIRSGAHGERHPAVATGQATMALDLARQGRFAEAEATALDAVRLLEEVLGSRHPDVGTGLARLAQVLIHAGRPGEADDAYRTAIDLKPPRNEGLTIDVAEIRREYGRALIDQRRYPEAEAQLLESLRLLEGVYGTPSHPNVDETKRALMSLYAAAGRLDMVERYRVAAGQYFPY